MSIIEYYVLKFKKLTINLLEIFQQISNRLVGKFPTIYYLVL